MIANKQVSKSSGSPPLPDNPFFFFFLLSNANQYTCSIKEPPTYSLVWEEMINLFQEAFLSDQSAQHSPPPSGPSYLEVL